MGDYTNSETAWKAWRADHPSGIYNVPYIAFTAGHTSRDAEVDALQAVVDSSARTYEELEAEHAGALQALAESRARFGDMEARVVELEAVIQKVRDWEQSQRVDRGYSYPVDSSLVSWKTREARDVAALIDASPSVVLADHDAAVWDEGFDAGGHEAVFEHDGPCITNPYRGDNR